MRQGGYDRSSNNNNSNNNSNNNNASKVLSPRDALEPSWSFPRSNQQSDTYDTHDTHDTPVRK
jgi:hypothetical protein